jgi:GNAT superfamily N-acetyltransferase
MGVSIVDVDLENFRWIPHECRTTLFWEMEHEDPDVNVRFQKEEWFSSTMLEWGPCGKLVVPDVDGDEAPGFAEYAPATLFPRVRRFAAGSATSTAGAVYLAYCYVGEGKRGQGVGSALVRDVARASVDRGYRAVEALGDRAWDGGWVLPVTFLAANDFTVVRDDDRYPLLRLDLRSRMAPVERAEAVAVPLPEVPAGGVP